MKEIAKKLLVSIGLTSMVILALLATPAPEARGEYDAGRTMRRPSVTTPVQIAMTFHRLTGQRPDFQQWAQSSRSYLDASSVDKPGVATRIAADLENMYGLLTSDEPLLVRVPAILSEYSRTSKGFFIENFKEDTYFSYSFNNVKYALIPQKIMDFQWVRTNDDREPARIEDAKRARPNKRVPVFLYLEPKFADAKAPLNLDGADHFLVMAEVKKVEIYHPTTDGLIWRSTEGTPAELDRSILNLKE